MSETPATRPALGAMLYRQPYLLLTLTMVFWSGNIVVARAVAGHVPPIALAQMRWTLAFLLVLPFAARHLRRDGAQMLRRWKVLTLLGLAGITIYNTFLYIGVQTTTAISAAMLTSIFPIIIAAVGFILYRDRLTPLQLVGILTSCVGALTILSGGSLATIRSFAFAAGDLWVIGSQIAYSFYVLRSTFYVLRSTFYVLRSTFYVLRSTF